MLTEKSAEKGFIPLAGHTDSAYIKVPFDKAQEISKYLTDVAQNEMNLKYLDVELEAYFDYWITAATKNRNFGIKVWPEEDAGQMKVTGFEVKASNATPICKRVQKTAFTMIATGKGEEEVWEVVRPIVKNVYKGNEPVESVSAYGRLSKHLHEYDKVVPNPAKAARYANEHLNTSFGKGEGIKWVFIDGVPEGQPPCNVIAYEDESQLRGYDIDWNTAVEKWITKKLKLVYETLDWDLEKLTERRIPKKYW